MEQKAYAEDFYDQGRDIALCAAAVIVPMVIDWISPRSVVDVGCGTGEWLSVFKKHGIPFTVGMDGDWVPRDRLQIPATEFYPINLPEIAYAGRKFDLAVSLEVAEHLPESAADRFVGNLVSLAPVVLFSAAIPYQGGIHHYNEQWQDYWAERFAGKGYICMDVVRERVWNDPSVAWWYSQNMLILVRNSRIKDYPKLKSAHGSSRFPTLSVVHPMCYMMKIRNHLMEKRQWAADRSDSAGGRCPSSEGKTCR